MRRFYKRQVQPRVFLNLGDSISIEPDRRHRDADRRDEETRDCPCRSGLRRDDAQNDRRCHVEEEERRSNGVHERRSIREGGICTRLGERMQGASRCANEEKRNGRDGERLRSREHPDLERRPDRRDE